jgi:hypothetical protein
MYSLEPKTLTEADTIEKVIGKSKNILFDNVMFRINCFEGTFVHLTERFNGKEVYLVGTAN